MHRVERRIPNEVRRVFPALNGSIEYNGEHYALSAHLELSDNGKIRISGNAPFQLLNQLLNSDESFSVTLLSEDGWELTCQDCWINRIQNPTSFEGSALKVTATFGQVPDPQSSHAYGIFVGGDHPFCGDYPDQLGTHTVIDIGCVGRHSAHLYGVEIFGLEHEVGYCYLPSEGASIAQDRFVIKRLQQLLSLAYARLVSAPWYGRFDDANDAVQIELTSAKSPGTGDGALYVTYPNQVSNLITRAWPRWDNEARGLNLVHLINQYVLVRDQKFVDAALTLGSVWMEAFKHQYAAQVKQYATDHDHCFLKPGSSDRYSFRELVEDGMTHYGVQSPYTGFIDVRNEVIHTGTITAPIRDQMKIRDRLEQAIEDLLFTILDYQGLIWDRGTGKPKSRT